MLRAIILAGALALTAAACSGSSVPDYTLPPSTTTTVASGITTTPGSTVAPSWTASADPCTDAGAAASCEVNGYPDRTYLVHLPASYDPTLPIPVVIAFHGGGGRAEVGQTMSCTSGDVGDANCLHSLGSREGFVTVYPNGSGFRPIRRIRTWNAGGGSDGWGCASGKACERDAGDVQYVDQLLTDLDAWLHVDERRVYAVGLSNGAAFAHRLACERSEVFAAIAAVAGSNQFGTSSPCAPAQAVSVLQIHGTEDPCWPYETSTVACFDNDGRKLGAMESAGGWANTLTCAEMPTQSDLADVSDDGTNTISTEWSGCRDGHSVTLLSIIGGGHTWPSGSPALSESRVGLTTFDWNSETIWEFLDAHAKGTPGN